MNMITKIIAIASFTFMLPFAYAADSATSPVGYWKTIDDVTGQPKAIVQITETSNHSLQGQIIKIYPRPGFDQNELCDACKGDKHNKRIVGMVILEKLQQDKQNAAIWDDGEILDPKNGKTYHCKIQLIENGEKLSVRGYIGIPLFGRSQTWLRVRSSQ